MATRPNRSDRERPAKAHPAYQVRTGAKYPKYRSVASGGGLETSVDFHPLAPGGSKARTVRAKLSRLSCAIAAPRHFWQVPASPVSTFARWGDSTAKASGISMAHSARRTFASSDSWAMPSWRRNSAQAPSGESENTAQVLRLAMPECGRLISRFPQEWKAVPPENGHPLSG
jgi:hypothetical protein